MNILLLLLHNLDFMSFISVKKITDAKFYWQKKPFSTSAAQFKQYSCIRRSCVLLRQSWLHGHMTYAQSPVLGTVCFCCSLRILNCFVSELRFCLWSLMGQLSVCMHEQRRYICAIHMCTISCHTCHIEFCGACDVWELSMTQSKHRAGVLGLWLSQCCMLTVLWGPHFPLEPELASNLEENGILGHIHDQSTLAYPFLWYFPVLSHHLHWKLWLRGRK